MSKGNTFENDLLKLIFNATPIANMADNAASAPITNLYVSLHESDPGETGNQDTNEISNVDYDSYDRVAVVRTSSGWTVIDNSVSPVADISFPENTGGGSEIATHVGIGTAQSGGGKLLYSGALSSNMTITLGVTPVISSGSTITED